MMMMQKEKMVVLGTHTWHRSQYGHDLGCVRGREEEVTDQVVTMTVHLDLAAVVEDHVMNHLQVDGAVLVEV